MPQCTAITHAGTRCKNPALQGTNPPRCGSHGGGRRPAGAPPGSRNAQKHDESRASGQQNGSGHRDGSSVDLDTRIADLNRRIEQLSHYLDGVQIGPGGDADEDRWIDVDRYIRLLALHGQLTSRLGRLLRDKHQIAPKEESIVQLALYDALDQASETFGVKL
jgi:hypothetical protein